MNTTNARTQNRLYLGDHLKVARIGYTHHGIYCGQGIVIAKTQEGVKEYTLDEFADGALIKTVSIKGDLPFSRGEIVNRARSRLGEQHYNLLTDNCEHFANWCTTGDDSSSQVRKAGVIVASSVAAATITAGLTLRHINKAKLLDVATTAASVHPAGGIIKAAVIAAKTAQTLGTAKDAMEIIKKDSPKIEKGIAIAGVVAGLSSDDACKIASKAHALGSKTIELSYEQAHKAVRLSADLLEDAKNNIKAQGKRIKSALPQIHIGDHEDNSHNN